MKTLLAMIMAISFQSTAWDKIPGYADELYALNGTQVETSGSFKRNAEIVYSPNEKLWGLSFYNYNNKEDQAIIPYATLQIRACQKYADGALIGPRMVMQNQDEKALKSIFSTCTLPVYMRIYDPVGNYSTYRFISDKEKFKAIK